MAMKRPPSSRYEPRRYFRSASAEVGDRFAVTVPPATSARPETASGTKDSLISAGDPMPLVRRRVAPLACGLPQPVQFTAVAQQPHREQERRGAQRDVDAAQPQRIAGSDGAVAAQARHRNLEPGIAHQPHGGIVVLAERIAEDARRAAELADQ